MDWIHERGKLVACNHPIVSFIYKVNYNARGPQVAFRIARIDYNATGQKIHILEYSTEANGRREVADELYLFQKVHIKYYIVLCLLVRLI